MNQPTKSFPQPCSDLRPEPGIFIPALLVIACISIPSLMYPEAAEKVMKAIYQPFAATFGTLYLWFTAILVGFCAYFVIGKYGSIKFGEPDEKPEFGLVSWIAMIFCSGVAGAVMFWSIVEPLWNIVAPPHYAEPLSVAAFDWSLAHLLLNWGPSAWCTYFITALPIAYMLYIKKRPLLRISSAADMIIGKQANGLLGRVVDVFFILGLLFCTAVTMCISLPTVAKALSVVLGIEATFALQIKILLVSAVIAGGSVYMGLHKGIKRLSDLNIIIALAMVTYGAICGPTAQLFDIFTNGVGRVVGHFPVMTFWTDPWTSSGFPQDWTIFYTLFWAGYGPFMGLFIARISRGRTVRELIGWGMLGTVAGGYLIHGVFGSYTLWAQSHEVLNAAAILKAEGGPAAMIAVLSTLPFSKALLLVYCLFSTIFLATSVDSGCYVVSATATRRLQPGDDPHRLHRAFWAVAQASLALGLLAVGGLEVAKIFGNFSGALMILPVLLLTVCWFKILRKDGPYLLKYHCAPKPPVREKDPDPVDCPEPR